MTMMKIKHEVKNVANYTRTRAALANAVSTGLKHRFCVIVEVILDILFWSVSVFFNITFLSTSVINFYTILL